VRQLVNKTLTVNIDTCFG